MDLTSDSSNVVYKWIELPSPPQIPPTKITGVSVEDRVEAYECRYSLQGVLDTMGMSKSYSPLEVNEYPIHPSPRRTVTTRVWRTSPAASPHSKVESDYETMLPQLGKLDLTESPIKRRPLPRHPCSPPPEQSTSPFTSDQFTSPTSSPHKYVVFKDKSTLFMPSPISKLQEPTYARIDDSWFDNDRSTDSGFSDRSPEIYENPRTGTCLTSDDISLISRYQRVLGNRNKKSRFKKLSEYLCSGGSNSGDEEETDDSLYDSLVSSGSSFNAASRSSFQSHSFSNIAEDTNSSVFDSPVSSPDETTVRYSKKHFFYTPVKKLDLHNLSTHSEYVLPEHVLKTPSSSKYPKTSLTSEPDSASPLKPLRKPPKSVVSPLCHEYENLKMIDFTKPRRARQQNS